MVPPPLQCRKEAAAAMANFAHDDRTLPNLGIGVVAVVVEAVVGVVLS